MSWFPVMQLLHFFAFIIYLFMAVYVLRRGSSGRKRPIHIAAAALFFTFSVWSFGTIFMHNPGTPQKLAVIFDKVITIAWMIFPSLALLLFTHQSGSKKILSSKLFYTALLLLPAFCIFLFLSGKMLNPPVKTGFGWYSEWIKTSAWPLVYFIYAPLFTAGGAVIFFFKGRKSESIALKHQASIVFLFTLLILLAGVFFDIIGPTYIYSGKTSPLNSIADIYTVIWAFAIYYAIVKYNMYSITTATAADNIIASMSEALFLLDEDLKIVYANAAAHNMLHYQDRNLFTKPFVTLLKQRGDINTILKTSLRHNSIKGFETSLISKNGSPTPVILSFNTLSEQGDIKGFSCIATDITERKISEIKIRMERDRAQKYLDIADIMFVVLDKEHKVVLINIKGCEILGSTESEVVGSDWISKYIPEEQKQDITGVFKQMLTNNNVIGNVENFIVTKTGKKRLIRWSNTILKSDSGEITGILSAGTDITEQSYAQEEIKKLSIAVEQSPSSIEITDTAGNITYVNPKFSEITGYTKDDVIGKKPSILKSGEWPVEKYKELWDTISSGSQWRGVFHNKKKNGELFWESASISPIKDYKNNILSYVAIKEDITAQKKAEEDLKESFQKLKELDMMKTSFTSMVSHELRTPLTSIKGFLVLLLSGVAGKLSPTQKEFLETIRNNSERLLNLINDILDVSKMEAGSFTIGKKPCNLIEITGSSIKDIHSIADKKNIKIGVESSIENPVVNADGYRLSQVMINLINNAIKFSPQGSEIKISLSPADAANIRLPGHVERPGIAESCILVSVTDSGIGINKENLKKIFTRFYQVENINTRHAQGTGLGLSIAKNIVEAHGGFMWVDSDGEGRGTTFSFLLPVS